MALQKSTIVMAVLTCIPFGFAVRDHFSNKDRFVPGEEYGDDFEDTGDVDLESLERESKEAMEAYEAERRREEAREAERNAGLAAAASKLFGGEPASLGPAFGAIKLGMSDSALDKQEDTVVAVRELADKYELGVTFHANSGVLDSITLESTGSSGEQTCEVLGEKLATMWPEPTEVRKTTVWVGKGQRVELTGRYDCKIEIVQVATPETWIAKTGSVIPFAMIGKSSSDLLKSLEPRRADLGEENYISWMAPGLGAGIGLTRLETKIEKGKLVGISAFVDIDDATFAALEQQLDAAFGPAKERDGEPVWGTKVPVRITVSNYDDGPTSHVLTIGKLPTED